MYQWRVHVPSAADNSGEELAVQVHPLTTSGEHQSGQSGECHSAVGTRRDEQLPIPHAT